MSRYIDADKLIQQIEADSQGNEGQYGDEWKFMDTIRSQPTADVRENVKGEWIIKDDIVPINFMDGYVETERCVCSNCGYEPTYAGRTIFPTTRTLLFCPNCGADMRGEAND